MAPGEPEGKVVSPAPFAALMTPHVQHAAKGIVALLPPGRRQNSRAIERPFAPNAADLGWCSDIKPAPCPAKIAAKLAN